jgi:hypothetical protein
MKEWIEEFDKLFFEDWDEGTDDCSGIGHYISGDIDDLKSFIQSQINQAVARERERHQAMIKELREFAKGFYTKEHLLSKLDEIGGKDDNSAIERIRGGKNE